MSVQGQAGLAAEEAEGASEEAAAAANASYDYLLSMALWSLTAEKVRTHLASHCMTGQCQGSWHASTVWWQNAQCISSLMLSPAVRDIIHCTRA